METVKLAGPVVSIENMDLVRHVDARGLGETEAYLFTHEILWVRCVIPTVSFWHGAEKVRDGVTYRDVRGFMNSVTEAVKTAETCCKTYDVSMQSTMRILINVIVEDVAVLRQKYDEKRDMIFGLYEYPAIPPGWRIHPTTAPLSTPRPVFESTIWTSTVACAVNTLCVEKFKERWNTPSLIEQR